MTPTRHMFRSSDEAYATGTQAAMDALRASPFPIFAIDEVSSHLGEDYAKGWNAVWGNDENLRRLDRR